MKDGKIVLIFVRVTVKNVNKHFLMKELKRGMNLSITQIHSSFGFRS